MDPTWQFPQPHSQPRTTPFRRTDPDPDPARTAWEEEFAGHSPAGQAPHPSDPFRVVPRSREEELLEVLEREAARPSQRSGAVALVCAVVALTGGALASFTAGTASSHRTTGSRSTANPQMDPGLVDLLTSVTGFSMLIWTALGLAALVLGSRAISRDAGRSNGITAVVLSLLAPAVCVLLWVNAFLSHLPGE